MAHKIIKKLKNRIIHRPRKVFEAMQNDTKYKYTLGRIKPSVNHPKLALVIHLYHIEAWDFFTKKIDQMSEISFDLFITMPSENLYFAKKIMSAYKNAYIVESPNRGRDVLPFMKVLLFLSKNNYEYILKVHSKRSTHRSDGVEWLHEIVNNLIPSDDTVLTDLISILEKDTTGIVGPHDQYLSLNVNFEANGLHMTRVLNRIYSKTVSYDVLQTNRSSHGFFAGTMFWARIDAIAPLLCIGSSSRRFEPEKGQIDATFAHATERLLSIIPQIKGKHLYEIDSKNIKQIEYNSGTVPDWSSIYIGPQAK